MYTFYILVLVGILLNVLGVVLVLPVLNILGFITAAAGAFRLAPLCRPFRTLRNLSITAIPFSILSLAILLTNDGAMQHTINCVVIGINIFFIIYNSYYFTSGITVHAKNVGQLAVTRNAMTAWALFGITIFLYFMGYSSLIDMVVFILKLVVLIFGLYYLFMLFGIGKAIFQNN
jgi:hypothetical protein